MIAHTIYKHFIHNHNCYEGKIVASFRCARRIILGRLKCQFHSCVQVSNLSSVCPPNSTTRRPKAPDNRRGEDTTFEVLLSQFAICHGNRKLPIITGSKPRKDSAAALFTTENVMFSFPMHHIARQVEDQLRSLQVTIPTCDAIFSSVISEVFAAISGVGWGSTPIKWAIGPSKWMIQPLCMKTTGPSSAKWRASQRNFISSNPSHENL